jgi:hypothetical protein
MAGTRSEDGYHGSGTSPTGKEHANMTLEYLGKLTKVAHKMLPAVRETRPLMYWHYKTTLILAMQGDFPAARDLAEQLGEFIEGSIASCLHRGDLSAARELENARTNILEGISS